MNPEDLMIPQSWEERSVELQDGILFIRDYYPSYGEFQLPAWSSPKMFGNDQPICIEYCSGNGEWVVEKAKQNPQINWIAVEKWLPRVRRIWSRKQKEKLPNLFIVAGEAYTFTKYYVASDSIQNTFINFPDPWPKKRHAKHRLLHLPFVEELNRILVEGGSSFFVSDDRPYVDQTIAVFLQNPNFISAYPFPFFTHDVTTYGRSYFDQLWRTQGKQIHYVHFKKQTFDAVLHTILAKPDDNHSLNLQ